MLRLPSLFTSHAVLQRGCATAVWGWIEPGAAVTVSFRGATAKSVSNADGRFDVRIATGSPGGPFELVVETATERCVVTDVLVGELWLCSGQSNMGFQLRRSVGATEAVAAAACAQIRLLQVPKNIAAAPVNDLPGAWQPCTPATAAEFSAVAFYFGKWLQAELGVPVGLICSAIGSTGAEAWTRREDLLRDPALAYLVDPPVPHRDPGIDPATARWKDEAFDDASWGNMECPTAWEHVGLLIDGAVWFRREVDLPADWVQQPLELGLGATDDFDHTYANGRLVGAIGPENPDAWKTMRRYALPPGTLHAGRNVIAVRVFDQWGCGGMRGPGNEMYLGLADDPATRISLTGCWRWKVELALPPVTPADVPSSALYNGMIHPLCPAALAGVLWYQGETNVVRAEEYRTLFPALINGWRAAWDESLPFLFVVLAGWHKTAAQPTESGLAELREAQLAALALAHTAAVSAVDVGDIEDIHPPRKREVGERLATAALATCYGRKVESCGPTLRDVRFEPARVRLVFDHAAGLHLRGPCAQGFAVAGADGVYVWADAALEGQDIVLTCARIPEILTIRYNWADNPNGNLYNAAGLPMLPFRTDDFPGVKVRRRP